MAAFKTGGAAALRKGLAGIPSTGTVQIGAGSATTTRFTIERVTADGRLLTILTDQPLLFVGAGVPGAKPKEGYDFAVIDIVVDAKGQRFRDDCARRKDQDESGRVRRGGLRRRGRAVDGGQEDKVGTRTRTYTERVRDPDLRISGGATTGGDPGSAPSGSQPQKSRQSLSFSTTYRDVASPPRGRHDL